MRLKPQIYHHFDECQQKCQQIESAICQLKIAGTRWNMLMVLLRTENPFSWLIMGVSSRESAMNAINEC